MKTHKKAKPKNDAIMTGILVTKYKMGQITAEDLELMAKDLSKQEKASAAKKVLAGIKGAGELKEMTDLIQKPDKELPEETV
jgi:hypothetical protein